MFMMQHVGHVLANSTRTVVTNLPFNWEGLEEVLNEQYSGRCPENGGVWHGEYLRKRIWPCHDKGMLRRFWLQRGFGWTLIDIEDHQYDQDLLPDWSVVWRYTAKTFDGKERAPLYKMRRDRVLELEAMGEVECKPINEIPPCQFEIDEAGDIFPKLSKSKLGPGFPHYLSHKRKIGAPIGDDTVMACQFAGQLDKELREQTNDWMFLVNWAARRKGIFHLPKKATWAKFPTLPQKGDQPMLTGFFAIDGKSWGRTYDTSAGVGIEGGFEADKGQKVGGISWMWIIVAFVALLFVIKFAGGGISSLSTWLLLGGRGKAQVVQSGPTNPVLSQVIHPVQEVVVEKKRGRDDDGEVEKQLKFTGVASYQGVLHVFFDDGSSGMSTDRRFGGVKRGMGNVIVGVTWEGKFVPALTGPGSTRELPRRSESGYFSVR